MLAKLNQIDDHIMRSRQPMLKRVLRDLSRDPLTPIASILLALVIGAASGIVLALNI